MIPLILLPGMMCDARLFGPQLEVLSATRAVNVLPITQHDSVEALASQVLAAAPERFALGGLSMGGIVAMEVVRQAPDRAAGLALMDTNPLAEAQAVKDMRGPQIQAVQNGKLQRVMQDDLKPNYINDGPNRRAILDLCLDMAMDLGADVFVRQSHALMTRPDQQDTLKNFDGPSLVLTGQDDRLCPLDRHTLMARLLKNSTLEVIENAGHLPTLEQPKHTNSALLRWLEDL